MKLFYLSVHFYIHRYLYAIKVLLYKIELYYELYQVVSSPTVILIFFISESVVIKSKCEISDHLTSIDLEKSIPCFTSLWTIYIPDASFCLSPLCRTFYQ